MAGKHAVFLIVEKLLTLFSKVSNHSYHINDIDNIEKRYDMLKKEEKNPIVGTCPVRNVVSRFGNKWALLVVLVLSEQETVRFNELCRLIPDVSSRVLSGTLKTLEADGLVDRKVYPVVPPKVEYRLTDIGHSLVPFILQLTEWAQTNMKTIIRNRKKFEADERIEKGCN